LASDHLPDSPSLVRDLLAYFVRHHHARATLDDLARWRIEQERASHTLDQVNRAIDWLEQPPNQLLVRWPEGPDQPGPTVFRLNPAKTADAERMLAQLSESPQVFDVARRGDAAAARAGMGRRDPAPLQPRTSADQAGRSPRRSSRS
jgi:hypothetical protein